MRLVSTQHYYFLFVFIPIYSQLQWEQYVDHYCRDFPRLFTKQTTDGHVPMDEGEVLLMDGVCIMCS